MLDRRTPPPLLPITQIPLPQPIEFMLDNGVKVWDVRLGEQDIIKLDISFEAGRWHELAPLTSRAALSLLREGTLKRLGAEIAETLDFYGVTLRSDDGSDFLTLSLYCLRRHFETVLPLLKELITEPSYTEKDLADYIEREKQHLLVALDQVDTVAFRTVTEAIFGSHHPYGYNSSMAHYDGLTTENIRQHFKHTFTAERCKIFLAGKTDDKVHDLINQYFGSGLQTSTDLQLPAITVQPFEEKLIIIPKSGSTQSALRIGRRLFTRQHPDFDGIFVLNTLLGGYFGARLMSNLREEKGYTYGIYSALDTMQHDGYWYIATEVNTDVRDAAIAEIKAEMELLQHELADDEEMTMLRNYLIGNTLRSLDGAFSVSEVVREMVLHQQQNTDLIRFIDTVRNITPEQLRDLARKYLVWEEFTVVSVG